MTNFDQHRIDKLQRKLYSRKNSGNLEEDRTPITQSEFEVDAVWEGKPGDELNSLLMQEREHKEKKQADIFKKILIGSVIFFVLALSVVGLFFFRGTNFVSGNNIDIQVIGPSSIGGGESLSLDILIKNNNNADLESSALLVEYPDGTRSPSDVTAPLLRERQDVGAISARSDSRKTIKAILYGEKDSTKQIKLVFEYRLKGSSATFFKEKQYDLLIKSSPVIVTIDNPREVNSNQEVTFVIGIASNSSEPLSDVLLKAEYPFGFTFRSSDVKPADSSNTLWKIDTLSESDQKKITIKGTLQGQNEEERTFRFQTGIENPEKENELGAVFSIFNQSIKIKRPFLAVDVTTGGNSSEEIIARPGERIQTSVSWVNNLPNKLLNTQVSVKFVGDVLNKSSVGSIGGGFYRSIDNTIVWDKNNTQSFVSFDPGDRGAVAFEFSPNAQVANGVNQNIKIIVTVSGDQVFDDGKQETISTVVEKTVKLATQANFRALAVRSLGAFENSGPVPPKVDLPTTYTLQWFATNSLNTIQKAKVSAVLPTYVSWVGLTSPGTELVSYDDSTRTVTWNIGDLKAGSGFTSATRSAEFQVMFVPSISQTGSAPQLLSPSSFTGVDAFTGRNVSISSEQLTTKFSTDPDYRLGNETVVK